MTSREAQFLAVYRAARVDDQVRYYRGRREQFERAHGQILALSALLLGLSSTVALLAGVSVSGQEVFAILAAILPALSTALGAYGALYAFDRHTKLYTDAVRSLRRLEAPNLERAKAEEAPELIAEYVGQVEQVFRTEQGQWGQLASEARPSEGEPTETGGSGG